MTTKHTTVILPNSQIENLKEQVRQLTADGKMKVLNPLPDNEILNNKNKPEYIICAAIWFHDDKQYVHQPRNIINGFVICGRRHHNCFIAKTLSEYSEIKGATTEGFLTSKDIFLDRSDAGKLAYKAGQISEETDCLFSEDLY